MLVAFGPGLFFADGPCVSFLGLPFPTRMALARLDDGSVWVWSPVALSPELERAVDGLGPVTHIVSPNRLHNLQLETWAERWPAAGVYAPPGLAAPDLAIAGELGAVAPQAWRDEIDQVVVGGSVMLDEVVFFHRRSRTAIVGDLVQRLEPASATGLSGVVFRGLGIVGERGRAPLEFRASFLRRAKARRAREAILGWAPERLIVAHGTCVERGATNVLRRALAWM